MAAAGASFTLADARAEARFELKVDSAGLPFIPTAAVITRIIGTDRAWVTVKGMRHSDAEGGLVPAEMIWPVRGGEVFPSGRSHRTLAPEWLKAGVKRFYEVLAAGGERAGQTVGSFDV